VWKSLLVGYSSVVCVFVVKVKQFSFVGRNGDLLGSTDLSEDFDEVIAFVVAFSHMPSTFCKGSDVVSLHEWSVGVNQQIEGRLLDVYVLMHVFHVFVSIINVNVVSNDRAIY